MTEEKIQDEDIDLLFTKAKAFIKKCIQDNLLKNLRKTEGVEHVGFYIIIIAKCQTPVKTDIGNSSG